MIADDEEAGCSERTLQVGSMGARETFITSHDVVFKSCRAVIKVAGEASRCRVQRMQNRCHC